MKAQVKVMENTHSEHFVQARKKDKEITTLQHNMKNVQTSLELEQREKDNLINERVKEITLKERKHFDIKMKEERARRKRADSVSTKQINELVLSHIVSSTVVN